MTTTTEKTRGLIVLDMNKLLCDKIYQFDGTKKPDFETIVVNTHFTVFIHPAARAFLEFCFQMADVGFWTSTTKRNAAPILEHLLTEEQKQKTVFRWYRDRTRLHPRFRKDSDILHYQTVKKLKDVWTCPTINAMRCYSAANTVICDDDPQKLEVNDPANVVICDKPFDARTRDTEEEEDFALISVAVRLRQALVELGVDIK